MIRATGCLSVRLAVLVSVAVGFGGCGAGGDQAGSFNDQGGARHTPDEIAQDVGLVADATGLSWTGPRGCHVTVIMTTRREVLAYVDAGDTVVTNPGGDVGFKFDAQPGCRKRLRAALEEVE